MTAPLIIALPGNERLASDLAAAVDGELGQIEMREFPDGETYSQISPPAPKDDRSRSPAALPVRTTGSCPCFFLRQPRASSAHRKLGWFLRISHTCGKIDDSSPAKP